MLQFAANLSMMFNEVPFLDRFGAARDAGFNGVEFLFPYDFPARDVGQRVRDNGLTQALFNLPPGDWDAGERGLGALPGREDEFNAGLEKALIYAEATGCKTLHAMAGIVPSGASTEQMFETFVENLTKATDLCADAGVTIVLEALNNQDAPGYFLPHVFDAASVVQAVGRPNIGLQFDFYHVQIMDGNLIRNFDLYLNDISHIQVSSVQGRHEPDNGEINYPFIFKHIEASSYDKWIGCEYMPIGATRDGLAWLDSWR